MKLASTGRLIGRYALLIVLAVAFLLPVIWTVSGSLKSNAEIQAYPPTLLPESLRWENYARVFELQPFALQYWNSISIMAMVCLITAVISTCAGYALARVRPAMGNVIFLMLLSGIFIPPEATIIPLFRMASSLGWIDTHLPLIVFTVFIYSGPFATFIMRQAFVAMPAEFGEAAMIDGAGRWRTFLQIYLPIARPSLAASMVLAAWLSWNQYLEPLIYLRSQDKFTVPLAVANFEDVFLGKQLNVEMAATTLSIIPILVLFMFAQRQVIAGLTAGGLKG